MKDWGNYGDQPPCEHLVTLREFLVRNRMSVYSEFSEEPYGWVDISCGSCKRTYQDVLRAPWYGKEY
jgi:hypothetical protein